MNMFSLTSFENEMSELSKSLKMSSHDSPQSELKILADENVNRDKLLWNCSLSEDKFAHEGVSGVTKQSSISSPKESPKSKAV